MNTIDQIIQKIILLGIGAPDTNALRSELMRQFNETGDFSQVERTVEDFMMQLQLENEKGVSGVVQNIADYGFGLQLTDVQTEQLVSDLMAQGIDTWAKLLTYAITTIDGELGARLDNRAVASELFTHLLTGRGRGRESDYDGSQALNTAREWIAGIGASNASLGAAIEVTEAIINTFIDGHVQGTVLGEFALSGATVFVDKDGSGVQDSGEISTITDSQGRFVFDVDLPAGLFVVTGGTNIATNQPFMGSLSAPAGATTFSPLTTLLNQLLEKGQADNIEEAETILAQSLNIPRIDLSGYDPVRIGLDPQVFRVNGENAVLIQAVTAQIVNLLDVSLALLSENTATDYDKIQAVNNSLLEILVNAHRDNQVVDLSSAQTIADIIMQTELNNNPVDIAETTIGQASTILSGTNTLIQKSAELSGSSRPQTAFSDVVRLQTLMQEQIIPAITQINSTGDLTAVVTQFTGDNLFIAVSDIEVTGQLTNNTPVNGGSFITNDTIVELAAVETDSDLRGFVINGVNANDYNGLSVSGAGDVNGDGLADLIVDTPFNFSNGTTNSGAIFVVFGKSDGTAVELSAVEAGSGGFVIKGVSEEDDAARSGNVAGDVNGDGLADLIVGAPFNGSGGASFVVFGKTDGAAIELSDVQADTGTDGFMISGVSAGDRSGFSVSGAGDVNGDGLADLIVGAYFDDPNGGASGASFVVFGKADGTTVELSDVEVGTGGFVINGVSEGDQSGRSVSAAGDVNGDGLADLIVGADGGDPYSSGASFVVFGKTDGSVIELSDVQAGTGGFVINEVSVGDFFGYSVSGAGDVNGDGFADLIVGAFLDDPNGTNSGASFVVFGKADGITVELSDVEAGTGGFVINGVSVSNLSGRSVSAAGDVNNDGYADLIVGAHGDHPNGTNSGASFVVFGKTDGTTVELSDVEAGTDGFVINGVSESDSSGISVSGAGDVNGDGFADLIVGAPYDDPNGTNSGASFVVFGGAMTSATVGTTGTDTLTGDASANQLVAGAGDDTLIGNGGADVLRGGAGNDILAISDPAFASLDGGTGSDTLRLDAVLNLDLRALADNKLMSIEVIDLINDGGNSTIDLNILDVLNINEAQTASNTLVIHGSAGDTVNLYNAPNGQTGTWAEVGATDVYEFTAAADGLGVIGTVTIDAAVTTVIIA